MRFIILFRQKKKRVGENRKIDYLRNILIFGAKFLLKRVGSFLLDRGMIG